jgi:hypothetical protein
MITMRRQLSIVHDHPFASNVARRRHRHRHVTAPAIRTIPRIRIFVSIGFLLIPRAA